MAKKNKTVLEVVLKEEKPFIISSAKIKDDYCEYSYEIKKGIGYGDTHSVKGKGIINDDLRKAMNKLNVH